MSRSHHTYDHRDHQTHTYKPSRQDTHPGPGEVTPLGTLVLVCVGLLIALSYWESYKKKRSADGQAANARNLLQKASAADRRWRPDLVRKRIDRIFPDVQRALRTGDPTAAAGHMTERGLRGLHGRIHAAADAGFRIEIDRPKIHTARALFVVDKTADVGDILWMEITGKRAYYEVALCDGCLREGSKQEVAGFTELWKLLHGPDGEWVVDEIVAPGGVDGMMQTLRRMYKAQA